MNRKIFRLGSVFGLCFVGHLVLNLGYVQAHTPKVIDRFIDHTSTIPVNEGEQVKLFLRERYEPGHCGGGECASNKKGPVVLMIHGQGVSSVPSFDLEYEDYDWMEALAAAGFDVFALDHQGYGFSERPTMDDPCNASLADQKSYLIPNPLSSTCPPTYNKPVESIASTTDEMDTAVEYIRSLDKGGPVKVNLIGWSRGGIRVIKYASEHPEKVERVILFAPAQFPPAPAMTVSLWVFDKTAQVARVLAQQDPKNCPKQLDPQALDKAWDAILDYDPLGATWGESGVSRKPGLDPRGYSPTQIANVHAPTMVIGGALDTVITPAQLKAAFNALGSTEKVLVNVGCASHWMPWEGKHTVLHDASIQWLSTGSYDGCSAGCVFSR